MLNEKELAAEVERLRATEREKEGLPWRLILKAFKPVLMWSAVAIVWASAAGEFISKLLEQGPKR